MKNRILALVCCLSLALGCVAYRPPEAKAIAIADDLFITSIIYSVMGYGGYQFSAKSMDTPSLADALAPHIAKFNKKVGQTVDDVWIGFANWLGYEDAAALRKMFNVNPDPPNKHGIELVINGIIFAKIVEFVDWLGAELGLKEDSSKIFYTSQSLAYKLADVINTRQSGMVGKDNVFFNSYPCYYVFPYWGTDSRGAYTLLAAKHDFTIEYHTKGQTLRGDKLSYSGLFAVFSEGVKDELVSFYFTSDFSWYGSGSWTDSSPYKCFYVSEDDSLAPLPSVDSSLVGALPSTGFSPQLPENEDEDVPLLFPDLSPDLDLDGLLEKILENLRDNTLNVEPSEVTDPDPTPDPDPEPGTDAGILDWIKSIFHAILNLPDLIAQAFAKLFAPDAAFLTEISNTFTNKFAFLPTLKQVGSDLFGMTPDSEPPVIWIHLDKAEGKYSYGGKVKALDMSWYQRYKADMDKFISGFLWLGFLWLLFKRAASIIQGGEMYTEYYNDIRDYYRSGKKDDGPTIPTNRRLKK